MSNIGLPLIPGTLPFACYPATPQALYNAMFQLGAAQTAQLNGIVISEGTPDVEDLDKAWVKLASGNPVGIYVYSHVYAQWIWPHASPANGPERRLFVGTLADLALYDGGDGLSGQTGGPMWAEDTNFQGRSPMGPGPIPDTVDTLTVATNYGSGQHTLTIAELPAHSHTISWRKMTSATNEFSGPFFGDPSIYPPADATQNTSTTGSGTPFSNVHPVRGAYVIKRTGRQYYRG